MELFRINLLPNHLFIKFRKFNVEIETFTEIVRNKIV